jgi:hypothetical protein
MEVSPERGRYRALSFAANFEVEHVDLTQFIGHSNGVHAREREGRRRRTVT